MPTFSVITPAYNAAATIADAIQSIQAQTAIDWEHIVIDDGSTDDTAHIVEELSHQDSRVRLLSLPENYGISTARNFAIDHANGEFLVFLDADDQAMPQRLERQYQAFSQDTQLAVVGSSVELFGNINKIITPSTAPIEIAIRLLFNCEFFITSTAIRHATLTKFALWFDSDYEPTEDWEFFIRLVRTQRMINLPEVLTRYRRSNTQITAELTDRLDDEAARLRHNQLIWLGVPKKEIDMEAHIAVSPCYWPLRKDISPNAFELKRVTEWINKLISVNKKTKRYPPNVFQQMLFNILENYHDIH